MENLVKVSDLIVYTRPYNSNSYFMLNYAKRFTNLQGDWPEGRTFNFTAYNCEDYYMIFSSKDCVLHTNGKEYNLKTSDIIIWKSEGEQTIYLPPNSSFVILIFSGKCANEILDSFKIVPETIYHSNDITAKSKTYMYYNKQIEYIVQELTSKKPYGPQISTGMLIEFFGLFSRDSYVEDDDKYAKIIYDSISVIRNNVTKDNNSVIEEIIKKSHLSKSRFYTLFKQYTGTSILQYIIENKLSIAADYLTVHGYSVKTTCKFIGFSDPLYFSRLFKKKYGIPPTEYKKNNINHNFIQNIKV